MKCTEAYTIIQRHLQYYTSDQTKEARSILQQFKEDFEKTDEALEDMTLKEICLNLKEIHFSLPDALGKKPCSTIREEYRKKTGKDLDEFYCEKAYWHAAEEQRKEMAGYREINTGNCHSSPDSAEHAEQTKRTEQSNQTEQTKQTEQSNQTEQTKRTKQSNQTEQTKRTEQSNQTAKKPDVSVKRFLDIIDAESRLIQIRGTQS